MAVTMNDDYFSGAARHAQLLKGLKKAAEAQPFTVAQAQALDVCRLCGSTTIEPGDALMYRFGEEYAHQSCLDHGKEKDSAFRSRQFGEIEATLILNCQSPHRLHKLGIQYDRDRSVLWNLRSILENLIGVLSVEEARRDESAPNPEKCPQTPPTGDYDPALSAEPQIIKRA